MELSSKNFYEHLPGRMLGVAFMQERADSRQSRPEALRELGGQACDVLLEPWEDSQSSGHAVDALRIAAMYGCMPSLELVASSQPQNIHAAQEVSDNLQDLCAYISSNEFLNFVHRHEGRASLIGEISEVAVLSTMWWSIASGYRDDKSYVLPASKAQDHGGIKDNRRFGADLVLRRSGENRQLIQVKSSDSIITRRKSLHYHPEIAVIVSSELSSIYAKGPVPLLKAIAGGHRPSLERANGQIEESLQKARRREAQHKQPPKDSGRKNTLPVTQ